MRVVDQLPGSEVNFTGHASILVYGEDLMKMGKRIFNLERLIVNSYGFDGKDDALPKRLLSEPLPEGTGKGHVVELDRMKEEYYKLRGWVDGKPTEEKLKELEILIV